MIYNGVFNKFDTSDKCYIQYLKILAYPRSQLLQRLRVPKDTSQRGCGRVGGGKEIFLELVCLCICELVIRYHILKKILCSVFIYH